MSQPVRRVVLLGLIALFGPVGCSASEQSAGAAGSNAALVVDDFGDTLRFAGPATRVVSLNPVTTELAFALSAGSTLVGLVLLCFFLLPGILYFMLKSGYRYVCPKCQMQIAADN